MSIKRGRDCHKSLHGVMANAGFGELIIKKGGLHITVPQSAITKATGIMKKEWGRRLKTPTLADAVWVGKMGGAIEVA